MMKLGLELGLCTVPAIRYLNVLEAGARESVHDIVQPHVNGHLTRSIFSYF